MKNILQCGQIELAGSPSDAWCVTKECLHPVVFQVSRKGSRDVADHMAIQMDDSDSITVSEQSEPSAECWQNMYKLLNFYSLISDPTGILEKSSPENCLTGGEYVLGCQPTSWCS